MSRGCFTHATKLVVMNDLGFLVVMVGGSKTMTKMNAHHFYKLLVTGYSVEQI